MVTFSKTTLTPEFCKTFEISEVHESFSGGQKHVFIVTKKNEKCALKVFIDYGEREIRELNIYKEFKHIADIPKILSIEDHEGDKIVFETFINGDNLKDISLEQMLNFHSLYPKGWVKQFYSFVSVEIKRLKGMEENLKLLLGDEPNEILTFKYWNAKAKAFFGENPKNLDDFAVDSVDTVPKALRSKQKNMKMMVDLLKKIARARNLQDVEIKFYVASDGSRAHAAFNHTHIAFNLLGTESLCLTFVFLFTETRMHNFPVGLPSTYFSPAPRA